MAADNMRSGCPEVKPPRTNAVSRGRTWRGLVGDAAGEDRAESNDAGKRVRAAECCGKSNAAALGEAAYHDSFAASRRNERLRHAISKGRRDIYLGTPASISAWMMDWM